MSVQNPGAAQREVNATELTGASRSEIGVQHIRHHRVARLIAAVDVDIQQLRQIEVHVLILKSE